MKINISSSDTENGITRIKGTVSYKGCTFTFNANGSPDKGYRAKLSVLSPEDNRILQVDGKQRRAVLERATTTEEERSAVRDGRRIEKLNASVEVYIKDLGKNNALLEEKLRVKAVMLYDRNKSRLQELLRDSFAHSDSAAADALFDTFGHAFLKGDGAVKEETFRRKKNTLQKICALLGEKPVERLKSKDIETVYNNLCAAKKSRCACDDLRLAAKFLDYCREKGYVKGPNPVERFLTDGRKGRDERYARAEASADTAHRLDFSTEQNICGYVQGNLHDGRVIALPLAMYAGLEIGEIADLRWGDVIIKEDCVLIRNFKPNLTGGTHNYTRPILPAGADMLLARRARLLETCTEAELQKLYVVSDPKGDGKKPEKTTLTNYVRTTLLSLGVSNKVLAAHRADEPKQEGGAGIRLLHEHYGHILETECGVVRDSGLCRFLRGHRITDVTSDNYCCYTGSDGVRRLGGVLRRDRRFDAPKSKQESEIIERETDDGMKEIVIPARSRGDLSAGTVELLLPAGCEVIVRAKYGLRGSYKAEAA